MSKQFIVIEQHGGLEYASIVIDKNGNNKVFDTFDEAQEEANECQDGVVFGNNIVELGEEGIDYKKVKDEEKDTMKYIIQEMYNSHKNMTFNIVHIGDLVCNVLGIEATFLPSGRIEEVDDINDPEMDGI